MRWDQVHAKVSWWFRPFFVGSPNMFNLYTSIQRETIQEAVSWYTTNPIKSPRSTVGSRGRSTFRPGGGRRVQDLSLLQWCQAKPWGGVYRGHPRAQAAKDLGLSELISTSHLGCGAGVLPSQRPKGQAKCDSFGDFHFACHRDR